MPTLAEKIANQVAEFEADVLKKLTESEVKLTESAAKLTALDANLTSANAKIVTLEKQIAEMGLQLQTKNAEIQKLIEEMGRKTGSIRGVNYPTFYRGTFAMSATNAQFPKPTLAAAVGGTQTGKEGAFKLGYLWTVKNALGKKFTGMPANFAFDEAILIYTVIDGATPTGTWNDWRIESPDFAQTAVNQNPVVQLTTPTSASGFKVNQPVVIGYTASDPEGQALVAKLLINDVEQSLSPASNAFTWVPSAPGTYAVKVKVTDPQSGYATSSPVNVTIVPAPTATRTLQGALNLNDITRTFDGIAHTALSSVPGGATMYFNATGVTQDLQESTGQTVTVGSEKHEAYKKFGYNIRNFPLFTTLAAGNYELEVYSMRLWDNSVSVLTVNGSNTNISAPAQGPYAVKVIIPVTLSGSGSITVTDKNTVDNPAGEGNLSISFVRLYKLS